MNLLVTALSPAYNVESHICSLVRGFAEEVGSLLVVDDGSSDSTGELLHNLQTEVPNLDVLTLPANNGKAAAISAGLNHILSRPRPCDIVVQMDADMAHSPGDVSELLGAGVNGGLVVGNRYRTIDSIDEHRRSMVRLTSLATRMVTGIELSDPMCGYRCYSKSVASTFAQHLSGNGYGLESEQIVLCRLFDFPVQQIDLSNSVPQDIKTKAIEFVDALKIWFSYSGQLGVTDETTTSIERALRCIEARESFELPLDGSYYWFQYVPYQDSYALSSDDPPA